MGRPKMSPARFWSRTKRVGSCLEWQGTRIHSGYGKTSLDGKTVAAHRLAWIFSHGPIPPGLYVCHSCDNPPCVEPSHLWLGTNTDNMQDMVSKGREIRTFGEKNPSARLTDEEVRQIRRHAANGINRHLQAKYFDVSDTTISDIVHGHTRA